MGLIERAGVIYEIIPGRLWQSGAPVKLADVVERGINAILCVGEEQQQWARAWQKKTWDDDIDFKGGEKPPKLRIVATVPLFDADNCLDWTAADAAIALGSTLLADPYRKLLVHCSAGVYRSVHVSAGIVAIVQGNQRDRRLRSDGAGPIQHQPTHVSRAARLDGTRRNLRPPRPLSPKARLTVASTPAEPLEPRPGLDLGPIKNRVEHWPIMSVVGTLAHAKADIPLLIAEVERLRNRYSALARASQITGEAFDEAEAEIQRLRAHPGGE